jgi:hypothetical protein
VIDKEGKIVISRKRALSKMHKAPWVLLETDVKSLERLVKVAKAKHKQFPAFFVHLSPDVSFYIASNKRAKR